MKKCLSIIFAVALVMSLAVPAFAVDATQQTDMTLIYEPAPSYSVSIPSTLELNIGDNYLPITVSDMEDFSWQQVVVNIDETNGLLIDERYYGLSLSPSTGDSPDIWYQVYDEFGLGAFLDGGDGTYTIEIGGGALILVKFANNNTKNINIKLPQNQLIVPNVTYNGYIVFGISLW